MSSALACRPNSWLGCILMRTKDGEELFMKLERSAVCADDALLDKPV
jgi:hypothetical protein